uniref:Uncharacterized protein LOC123617783 n=1 Tax=Camelus bactrianus TaxID=9837 RepID=A0A9W3G9P2_CAMBA|nr:uncharacterized protein LOC123617783 [Camelus bactrianus]
MRDFHFNSPSSPPPFKPGEGGKIGRRLGWRSRVHPRSGRTFLWLRGRNLPAELGPARARCLEVHGSIRASSLLPPSSIELDRRFWFQTERGCRSGPGNGEPAATSARDGLWTEKSSPVGREKRKAAKANAFSAVRATKRSTGVRDFTRGSGVGKAGEGGLLMEETLGPGDGSSYADRETPSLALGAPYLISFLIGSRGIPRLRPRSDAEARSQPQRPGFRGADSRAIDSCPRNFAGHRAFRLNRTASSFI